MTTNIKAPNMKAEEKNRLKELAIKYKDILECKKSDVVTIVEKNKIWKRIADEFNANSFYKRSEKQLRTTYQNLKQSLKKDMARDKVETFKTGGGSFIRRVDNNDPLVSIVEAEVQHIPNIYDSSSKYLEDFAIPDSDENFEEEYLCETYLQEMDTDILVDVTMAQGTSDSHQNEVGAAKGAQEPIRVVNNRMTAGNSNGPSLPGSTQKKKRKNNKDLRQYIQEFSNLKKQKVQVEIEESRAKTEMLKMQTLYFKKQIELADVQIQQIKNNL